MTEAPARRRALSPTMASAGYTITLSLGCVAFMTLGCALGGVLLARQGRDVLSAFGSYGLGGFLFGAALLFLARIVFWDRAGDGARALVRLLITIALLLGLFASLPAMLLPWTLPEGVPHASMPRAFGVLDALGQIPALWWLLRFRREPD